jgi:hypothetical protein
MFVAVMQIVKCGTELASRGATQATTIGPVR